MIPKIIHVSWKDKNILDDDSDLIKFGIRCMVDINPDWELQVSDDDDVEEYLSLCMHKDDYMLLKDRHIVEKLDVWRLFKLYGTGGIYTDIDRPVDTPISVVVGDNIKCVLPTCLDFDFSHDFMMSAPGNPIYATALKMNLERRRAGADSVYYLGAQTYMNAVTKCLIGEELESQPGPEKFDSMRELINGSGFMQTFCELPPTLNFLYRSRYMSNNEYEWMKRDFYTKHNTKHWTGQW